MASLHLYSKKYHWRIISIIIFFLIIILIQCSKKKHFENIDYKNPPQYVTVLPNNGSQTLIDSIAGLISGKNNIETMSQIWFWIQDNCKYAKVENEKYRNFEQLFKERTYSGSSSHSVIFGTLCRAKGIPTVWAKTVDFKWIADYQQLGESITYYSGYTYLECFLDNSWKLVDAYGGIIYDDHDVQTTNLPSQRHAYGKGADPFALILDTRWDAWLRDILTRFKKFPVSTLSQNSLQGRDFLLETFKGKRPSIGVKIKKNEQGIIVLQVKKGYPADKAGILPADVITKIDNDAITDVFQLVDIIVHKGFNIEFNIALLRDNKELVIPVSIPEP